MLHYCSEILSAYYCSQFKKKLQLNFKMAAEIINSIGQSGQIPYGWQPYDAGLLEP